MLSLRILIRTFMKLNPPKKSGKYLSLQWYYKQNRDPWNSPGVGGDPPLRVCESQVVNDPTSNASEVDNENCDNDSDDN